MIIYIYKYGETLRNLRSMYYQKKQLEVNLHCWFVFVDSEWGGDLPDLNEKPFTRRMN